METSTSNPDILLCSLTESKLLSPHTHRPHINLSLPLHPALFPRLVKLFLVSLELSALDVRRLATSPGYEHPLASRR
jgi:hypothetical protein